MDANDYYKRGNASAAAKNYDPAIADYTEAIRRVPDTPKVAPVYNARGIAYYNKGDFAKALGDFSEVLRLTPDNARAYENRGKVYQHEKDFPAAIGDFKKSLELASNNPILRENLEKLLALTGGDNPSPETGDSPADPEVSVSAESGNSALPKQFSTTEPQDPQTQFELGLGCHNVKNNEKAVYWYTKAAKQGHASAQYNLGFCYTRGEGVRKNDETAVQWFAKAAEQGLAQGQYVLGFSYHKGIGIPQDTEKAVYWYEKAAKQGDSRAQEELQKLKNRVPQNRPSPETEKPSPPSSPSPQNGNLAVDSNNASPLPK
ncbi:MAG: tetratricopeptide repeat protein, partial [Spirochaetaceae bacterium]|nr:tetratricopeptide repeat protein [Spirochaetaceae bacterium]